MIALLLTLMAPAPPTQAVQATLQSCAMEQGRWVCRYQLPAVEIIPFTGPASEVQSTTPASPNPGQPTGAPPVVLVPTAPAADAVPAEASILTEREARLVARCADAGWMSLCLPDDRRAARVLRDRQSAYQTVQRSVTGLLAEGRCADAIRAALDGGYLGLAREARDFCTPSGDGSAEVQALVPPGS